MPLALVLLAAAWQPLLTPPRAARPRAAAPSARIKNAASEGAAEWKATVGTAKNPSLTPPKQAIAPDAPDMSSPQETFDALCRMCGVAVGRDATIDFDAFVLGFEQLYLQAG